MAKNDQIAGPYWTKHWIEKMWRFTSENFVDFDTGSVDFEALGREEYEFRKALFFRNFKNSPRAKEAFDETAEGYKAYVANGKKGGRPRKETINGDAGHREAPDESATVSSNSEDRQSRRAGGNSLRVEKVSTSPARSAGPMPEDKQAVMDFASLEGLDVDDAYECWHVTVNERGGLTADNKPINNWKAYVRKWCATRNSRRTA